MTPLCLWQGKDVNVKACLQQYTRRAAFRRGDLRRAGQSLVNYAVNDLEIIANHGPKLIAQAEAYLEAAKQEAPNVTEDNTKKVSWSAPCRNRTKGLENIDGHKTRFLRVHWTRLRLR